MTIGSWYLERYVVYMLRNALGSVASNPIMVYLWGYLWNFSNLDSCCFFFGQDSVATEENHNISHVSGHWLRTTLNHILTSQVIGFLLSREAYKEKAMWQSLLQGYTVRCAEHVALSMVCSMQQKGESCLSNSLCKPEPLIALGKLKTAHSCDSLWF